MIKECIEHIIKVNLLLLKDLSESFTSISKNVYIDKLDNIENKYSNTYRRIIKMKPADVNSSTYIDFNR